MIYVVQIWILFVRPAWITMKVYFHKNPIKSIIMVKQINRREMGMNWQTISI